MFMDIVYLCILFENIVLYVFVIAYVCGLIDKRLYSCLFFFFQAEDGIRDLVRSRGLGDVYKRQVCKLIN